MKRALRIALSLAIAGILLWLLVIWGDVEPRALLTTWQRLPAAVYAQALAVHMSIYLLRALRFRILIPPRLRPGLKGVLAVSSAHNLASYVLPAKTGEASLVVYLKRVLGVPAAEGLASLLVSRLLDLGVLTAAMALACLTLELSGGAQNQPWMLPLGVALALLALLLLLFSARSRWLVQVVLGFTRGLGLRRTGLGRKIGEQAERVADALEHSGGEGRLVSAALLSIPLWLGVFLFYAILAQGLGLLEGIDLPRATFGSGLAVIANLLPINGFAGFGTQETGWVIGFGALGVAREQALATGVGVHLVQLFNVVLLGFAGHLAMGWLPRPRAEA